MKIANAYLDEILKALTDLGSNRLPFEVAESLAEKKSVVKKAIETREKLKQDLVTPYIPKGKTEVGPGDKGYEELVDKILQLFNKQVNINLGKSISVSHLGPIKAISCKESTIRVLRQHKILIGKARR